MSTATTAVTICSNASLMLGGKAISSLDENNDRTRLASNLFEPVRDYVLRRHPWNCLQKRVVLSPRSDTPAFGWSKWFDPPGDLLRVIAVGTSDCPLDYAYEGGRILCDTSILQLQYLTDATEGNWDSNLVNVMVKRMEMDLAYPITKSTSLADSLVQKFYARGNGVLAVSKAVDGQENQNEQFGDSPFLQVRGGY
jgi:hypothetical protein